jgi:hypothetical protein
MRLYVSSLLLALVTALLIPISAGAQESADCAAVIDSDGARVARWQGGSQILLGHQGRVAGLEVSMSALSGSAFLYFDGLDCEGDEYMKWHPDLQPEALLVGTDVWFPDTTATPATLLAPISQRHKDDGTCTNIGGNAGSAVPALHFTLPTFAPPFHLEPEPCFTPPDPDPEQIINGCVKNKNGTLRIVTDPADCTSRETPISWVGQ